MKNLHEMIERLTKNGKLTIGDMELTALSNPVPGLVNGVRTDRFFLMSNRASAVRQRPHAWLELNAETGELMRYVSCAADDFAAGLGMALTAQIDYAAAEQLPVKEIMALRGELSKVYEQVREFAFAEALDDAQKQLLHQYSALISRLWKPELRRFYEALAPEFFGWMTARLP